MFGTTSYARNEARIRRQLVLLNQGHIWQKGKFLFTDIKPSEFIVMDSWEFTAINSESNVYNIKIFEKNSGMEFEISICKN